MRMIAHVSLLAAAGLMVGGASSYVTDRLMAGKPLVAWQRAPALVSIGALDAPLVGDDGRLLGYIRFEARLRVSAADAARIEADLPLLLDAINRRSFKAPIAARADGTLPRLAPLRQIVADAARETFASVPVQQVLLTNLTHS